MKTLVIPLGWIGLLQTSMYTKSPMSCFCSGCLPGSWNRFKFQQHYCACMEAKDQTVYTCAKTSVWLSVSRDVHKQDSHNLVTQCIGLQPKWLSWFSDRGLFCLAGKCQGLNVRNSPGGASVLTLCYSPSSPAVVPGTSCVQWKWGMYSTIYPC